MYHDCPIERNSFIILYRKALKRKRIQKWSGIVVKAGKVKQSSNSTKKLSLN